MDRRLVFAIALGAVLVSTAILGVRLWQDASLGRRAGEAAARGGAWLLAQEIPFRDPGILWIMSIVNDEYCQNAAVRDFVVKRFEREFDGKAHPIYPALRGSIAPEAREGSFAEFSEHWSKSDPKGDVLAAMAYGLYCDRMTMPVAVEEMLFATSAERYQLTHQYLALQYMERTGCASSASESALSRVGRSIADEHESDPEFTDLYAERVAVLLYGDAGRLVEPSWIETIVASQQASGAWSDASIRRRFYRSPENPHTTAVAMWALAEFSHNCPFPETVRGKSGP